MTDFLFSLSAFQLCSQFVLIVDGYSDETQVVTELLCFIVL